MTKFTLVCDHSCDLDTHVVTNTFNADYLPDVLMNIEQFLRGAGYYFDGKLEIVEDQYCCGAGTNYQSGGAGHSEHFFDTERNR
jgi:hypothetical protein